MVSIFGSVGKCFGRELKEAKESNVLLALEFSFFLSLCCLDKMVAKGREAILAERYCDRGREIEL